ncbi:MAG: sodium:proton exchanger [Lentimicrobiaceae bacterium]|nr:sodium:proton exchanger [Lentimicrobiaceae bacterium]
MLIYLLFLLGFVFLIVGAKLLIDGASSVGERLGLPQLIIGLTIVALGTSLPELVINVFASFEGNTDLAIGNVLGSNIMNTLLIIGICAIIYPIKVNTLVYKRDLWINLLAIFIMALLANNFFVSKGINSINRSDGIILLLLFTGLMFLLFKEKGAIDNEHNSIKKKESFFYSISFILIGITGLFFGGKWIVKGASIIANDIGVSQSTIGLTLIAMATSLPELITSIIAALNKNTDMAIGNALGSNIFNIFLVLGASAIINPINFNPSLNIEIGILIIASLFLILTIRYGRKERTISRLEGIFLTIAYFGFLIWTLF